MRQIEALHMVIKATMVILEEFAHSGCVQEASTVFALGYAAGALEKARMAVDAEIALTEKPA